MLTLDEFFHGHEDSRPLCDALLDAVNGIGRVEMTVSKSQIALRRKKQFAWIWIPGKYLRGKTAPLVLSLAFPQRDPSPRWKEIVEPAAGRLMHHLELYSIHDLNDEVRTWLQTAWESAGA